MFVADDRRNSQLVNHLKDKAILEMHEDGVISCDTQIALAEAGVDPDRLQERIERLLP